MTPFVPGEPEGADAPSDVREEIEGSMLSLPMNRTPRLRAARRPLVISWLPKASFFVPVGRRATALETRVVNPRVRAWKRIRRVALGSIWVIITAIGLAGCSSPAVRQQRLVSKTGMTFSDSAVQNYNSPRLLPQIASGFPGGDASQNSGCSTCR